MLKRNLVANYIGQGWTALMGLAFIPLYIKFLGVEAFGLIAIFAVLQAFLSLLDVGMTPTLNREMARFRGGSHSALTIRDLLRSIEIVALGIAIFILLGIWFISSWLARDWVQSQSLSIKTIQNAFVVMGVVASFRFLEGIYRSAIIGLQHQVLFNVVSGALSTMRSLGAVGILIWVSPTISAFFIWQALVSALSFGIMLRITYNLMPKASRSGQFSRQSLREVQNFSGGMMGILLLALILTQADKILLSKLLTLHDYGYYSLAAVVASALYMLATPITTAWFPLLSTLHAQNKHEEFIEKYHQGAQLVSVIVGSSAIAIILFSKTLLEAWTNDNDLATKSGNLLSILALGNLLSALLWLPGQAQLAYGWTRLSIIVNIFAVIIFVPMIISVTPLYGGEGAAWIWVLLNIGYILISIPLMHRRILKDEKWRWYLQDTAAPLLAGSFVGTCFFFLAPLDLSFYSKLIWLACVWAIILFVSAIAANKLRHSLMLSLSKFWLSYMRSK